MKKILVIDNYDSFTYNLVHYLEDLDCEVTVYRNDEFDIDEIAIFYKILLSPGPGIPDEAGLLKEVIQKYGANVNADLAQLWKRIVFNIVISNTDDHLRNHGFILSDKGWLLSPAYDINPSVDKSGLSLNIDLDNNDLDIELAKSVGAYFRLNVNQMNKIIEEVLLAVKQWRNIANEIGIGRMEQELMCTAFKC